MVTSREALERFFVALAAADDAATIQLPVSFDTELDS